MNCCENIINSEIDYCKFKSLIFMDLEYISTKYKENGHRENLQEIIEIGLIVKQDYNSYTYNNIIKPRYYMDHLKSNYGFTKLTLEELSNGIDLSSAVIKLNRFYKPDKAVIITWGDSDICSINLLCKKYNLKCFYRKEDYLDLSQKFMKFYNFKKPVNLNKALYFLKINDKYNRHRALPDTEILIRVFEKMIKDGYTDSKLLK